VNISDFLILGKQTQMSDTFLNENKLLDDFLIFHSRVFEILNISTFLFHLMKQIH